MAWSIVGISAVAAASSGNLTLNAPDGTPAVGDLLVACIGMRSNVAFTPPAGAGWNLVGTQQTSGDTDATSGIASGGMWYRVNDAASDPSFAWTRTGGDIAQGIVLRYRGGDAASIYFGGNAATRGTLGEPTAASIASVPANALIVHMVSSGDANNVGAFDAVTDPSVASGANATPFTDESTAPTVGTWVLRFNTTTGTGADHGLAVADGVKTSTGATGTMSAIDATGSTRSVSIVAVFNVSASEAKTLADGGSGADAQTIAAQRPLADTGSGVDAETIAAAVSLQAASAGLQYFGQQTGASDDDNGGADQISWYWNETFQCPGSGDMVVKEISAYLKVNSGTPVVRLGVYDNAGNLVCEGTGTVTVTGAGYSWQGHMVATAITPNPAVLTGGQYYRIAIFLDGGLGTTGIRYQSGGASGDVRYSTGVDYGSGMPATIGATGTAWTGLWNLRVGVEATGGGEGDTGVGTDALSVVQQVAKALSDSGAGADAIATLLSTLTQADGGGGVDLISALQSALAVVETGSGSDVVAALSAMLALVETGSGADVLTIIEGVAKTLADTGSGVDAQTVVAAASFADSGSGVDGKTILATVEL
jgi:hypothetical protein